MRFQTIVPTALLAFSLITYFPSISYSAGPKPSEGVKVGKAIDAQTQESMLKIMKFDWWNYNEYFGKIISKLTGKKASFEILPTMPIQAGEVEFQKDKTQVSLIDIEDEHANFVIFGKPGNKFYQFNNVGQLIEHTIAKDGSATFKYEYKALPFVFVAN